MWTKVSTHEYLHLDQDKKLKIEILALLTFWLLSTLHCTWKQIIYETHGDFGNSQNIVYFQKCTTKTSNTNMLEVVKLIRFPHGRDLNEQFFLFEYSHKIKVRCQLSSQS